MKTVCVGAEAVLYSDKDVAVKERVAKGYREKALDYKIRKQRTKREAKLLDKAARAGICVPKVLDVKKFNINMELIEGPKIKDVLAKDNMETICKCIGESIARLHAASIVHGDLTTSNMILSVDDVYFIDFGLGFISEKPEDMATDLHLLEEAIVSTHHKIASDALDIIFETYVSVYKDADDVISRLEKIKKRGRYVKRQSGE